MITIAVEALIQVSAPAALGFVLGSSRYTAYTVTAGSSASAAAALVGGAVPFVYLVYCNLFLSTFSFDRLE